MKALYAPRPDGLQDRCTGCTQQVQVELPAYLSATEYTAFGGCVIGFGMAALLSIDVEPALRIQLIGSALILFVGLLALLTWTRARLK